MKRKLTLSAALAFLLCSVLGHAQEAPAKKNVAVETPGGKVSAVAKFTATNIIGNSAISETGGNRIERMMIQSEKLAASLMSPPGLLLWTCQDACRRES
jgi:hypothetical protein